MSQSQKADVRMQVAKIVARHTNALYREIEQYYGVIHLNQVDSKSYKLGIEKIWKVLFRAVARQYYDFGGRW